MNTLLFPTSPAFVLLLLDRAPWTESYRLRSFSRLPRSMYALLCPLCSGARRRLHCALGAMRDAPMITVPGHFLMNGTCVTCLLDYICYINFSVLLAASVSLSVIHLRIHYSRAAPGDNRRGRSNVHPRKQLTLPDPNTLSYTADLLLDLIQLFPLLRSTGPLEKPQHQASAAGCSRQAKILKLTCFASEAVKQ